MFYLPAMAAAAAVVMPIAAVAQETPEVCFMLYMMADNDLEGFIYQDLVELYSSPALVKDNLNTWIYFDSHGGPLDCFDTLLSLGRCDVINLKSG